MSEIGIPCLWMRGGTSKAACFVADDLPADAATRDALLLQIMGSPDPAQVDGIGGGTPLTSKVAVLARSKRVDADIDYLFLQVFVDRAVVSDRQPCGNVLAAVAPAAIERGLVVAHDGTTDVRIHMVNTGQVATARVQTPEGRVTYQGDACIAGVPGSHAPVRLTFPGIAGSMTGSLLPTGNVVDMIEGASCTLIDNGMPIVVLRADALGVTGSELPELLEANAALLAQVERIRLAAGDLMGMGDVSASSSPKVVLVSPPKDGGVIDTRCFIPHRVHTAIGVFAAISVATAAIQTSGPASDVARPPEGACYRIEHPTGAFDVFLDISHDGNLLGAGTVRTARKLFDGWAFPS